MKRCKQCGDELTARQLPSMAGSSVGQKGAGNDVRLVIQPMPYLGCSCGAERRAPFPDFFPEVRPMINDKLPVAKRAMFGGKLSCGSCGHPLASDLAAMRTFRASFALEGTIPFVVEIVAKGLTCASCGSEQLALDKQLDSDLSDALIDAIDRERIKPT